MTFSLAELCICASAETFRGDGELMVTSIGLVPRLAASLAKATFEPGLMMTEGEAFLVAEPVPVGPNDLRPELDAPRAYPYRHSPACVRNYPDSDTCPNRWHR